MKFTQPPLALMRVDEGEEIAGTWITPHIPQTGCYKLLAKRKTDGSVEWVHFVQRDDGRKEKVYRGSVADVSQLENVLTALNNALRTAYGPTVRLLPAETEMYLLDGTPLSSATD